MEPSGELHTLTHNAREESLICIVQEAGWAPQPVWTFWRRENLLSLPGNKPIFVSCPAGSPFITLNELSYLMYDCVYLTGRTYNIGTARQSVVKHNHSGQLEPMKMNGAHPRGVLTSCSIPHQILKFKNTHIFCRHDAIKHLTNLPFSQTQPLKLADD